MYYMSTDIKRSKACPYVGQLVCRTDNQESANVTLYIMSKVRCKVRHIMSCLKKQGLNG